METINKKLDSVIQSENGNSGEIFVEKMQLLEKELRKCN